MAIIDPPAITDAELTAAIQACAADNTCEAAWQASYAYAADQAYKLAIFQALQGIAFGILQYNSADRAADQQYDIADRQMKIAEEEYARYKAQYAPCEDALNAEICALELPDVDYDTRADRALRDVRAEFSILRQKAFRNRSRYCMADQMRTMCENDKAEALAVIMARDMTYRYAENYQDVLDEKRWTRRLQMVTLGRGIMSGQSADYSSAMGTAIAAVQAGQDAYARLLGTISGGIGAIGNAYSARNMANRSFNSANINSNAGPSMIYSGIPSPGGLAMSSGRMSGHAAFA